MKSHKCNAVCYIENKKQELTELSDQIWDNPEIAFQEYFARDTLCAFLEKEGFIIEKNVAGIPTAFKATFGKGSPVIGILGEYDALYGMSQEANCFEESPVEGRPYGHGCGHHMIGSAAAVAAAAVRCYLEDKQAEGTLVYFGCPGEEGGAGKAFMVRDGVFDDVDCALTWHPADTTRLFTGRCLANISAIYHFSGVSAHAAEFPHLGRSALDAVELMNVGVNFLREHIVPDARVHYSIVDTGGMSPNVVQSQASVYYYMRAPELHQVKEIYQRIGEIAKGAALMTGTSVETEYIRGVNSLLPNQCLNHIMHKNMSEIPLPEYTQEEIIYAERIRKTISRKDETIKDLIDMIDMDDRKNLTAYSGNSINNYILPEIEKEPLLYGSTDVGDVSMKCPVAQLYSTTYAAGTTVHSWQAVSQGKSSISHKGELYAAKVLSTTAIDLFEDNRIIQEAKRELEKRLHGQPFESLIPKEIKPKIYGLTY